MNTEAVQTERLSVGGLVGFLMGMMRRGSVGFCGARAEKQMKLLETLSLGPKRQVMLVSCEGKKYLVGAGTDGVQTIVAVEDGEVQR